METAAKHIAGWQNPYVTDGLIAMWDGEWNEKGGSHNLDISVWKDISGNGNDLNLRENAVILQKALTSNGFGAFAWKDGILSPLFAEVCFDARLMTSSHTNHILLTTGNKSQVSCNIFIYGTSKYLMGSASTSWYPAIKWEKNTSVGTVSVAYSPDILGKVDAFFWNSLQQTQQYSISLGGATADQINVGGSDTRTDDYSSEGLLFHCIRLYDRCLSHEEVIRNCSIDRKRFGI